MQECHYVLMVYSENISCFQISASDDRLHGDRVLYAVPD